MRMILVDALVGFIGLAVGGAFAGYTYREG
jgi:hypothetical protein